MPMPKEQVTAWGQQLRPDRAQGTPKVDTLPGPKTPPKAKIPVLLTLRA